MKGLKKRRSPKQFFKNEIFTYNVDGKGMNAIYYKARRYVAAIIDELDIAFTDYPPWSPDLHPIEHCFG
ncbi:hypothetical protein BU26DRAFT_522221 [Trematosphaeria pertusa]|uniref:Uncharacterized protein n=1 Tax=Trematosphaeria pertusa TaxID=390896 RepID=A0A6A6I3M3_9PLEO|nr:uncharacterized protein BU26DRAFT_522221 [Trematosphaeria pertusa]KAF2245094.1 hypothetical protein BU26DRAFT_522221 [Trematosphaeria pertusa]